MPGLTLRHFLRTKIAGIDSRKTPNSKAPKSKRNCARRAGGKRQTPSLKRQKIARRLGRWPTSLGCGFCLIISKRSTLIALARSHLYIANTTLRITDLSHGLIQAHDGPPRSKRDRRAVILPRIREGPVGCASDVSSRDKIRLRSSVVGASSIASDRTRRSNLLPPSHASALGPNPAQDPASRTALRGDQRLRARTSRRDR